MIPPIIPLISDTPRLHQRVSRLARRRHSSHQGHATPMALRRQGRNFATRSAHTSVSTSVSITRRPPKVMRHVLKTSVSYETSSKSHTSSLQNERFVRDVSFLKNSHVKVCKTSVSYETSSKSQAETPIGANTHHTALPSSFAIPAPPSNTRSHANPNVTATAHLYHQSSI